MGNGCGGGSAVHPHVLPGEVSIWWDYENLTPALAETAAVAGQLREVAARSAPGCALTAFSAYVDHHRQGDAQLAALTVLGIDCIHSIVNARKRAEASDKALALALLLWLWERGERAVALILVTSDHDFAPLLAKLVDARRVRVVLVTPLTGPRAVRPALLACGALLEDWSGVLPQKRLRQQAADAPSGRNDAAQPAPAIESAAVEPSGAEAEAAEAAAGGRGTAAHEPPRPAPSARARKNARTAQRRRAQSRAPAAREGETAEDNAAAEAAQLALARTLLAEAGAEGIARSEFKRAYQLRFGREFDLDLASPDLTAPRVRGAPRAQRPKLGEYLLANGVAVVVTDGRGAARLTAAAGQAAGGNGGHSATREKRAAAPVQRAVGPDGGGAGVSTAFILPDDEALGTVTAV